MSYKDQATPDKPRVFRKRKTHAREELRDQPLHRPYERPHKNWLKEADDAEDIFRNEPIVSDDY